MRQIVVVIGRVLASLTLIAAITYVFIRLKPANEMTTGFFYLVAILLIATAGGLVESTIASVVATLCFNFFFIPPTGTFTIADPRNWVALFAFLATSLTASHLSERAKRQTREAVSRRIEMERLYSLSRGLLLADTNSPMGKHIVQQIAQTFDFSGVALYDRDRGEFYQAGTDDLPDIEARLRGPAVLSSVGTEERNGVVIAPIRLGREPIGSLAVRGQRLSEAAMQSLVNVVAIGLERAHTQEAVNRAQVARQSDELKSTLLDAIAHEFKSPLTSIKAVTTDLLSEPPYRLRPHYRELITIADEGTDRLSRLVTDAIQLARIEGGTFRLNREVCFPGSLVSAALRRMKPLTNEREITVSAPDDLPLVWVDAGLMQLVIAHLIDNALKYSPPDSAISVCARAGENKVTIHVIDHGPGITEDEQARIFEKFYRGKNERTLVGSGLGLAIAREIIRAHGQDIWVTSKPGQGSEFAFSLPIAPRSSAP